MQPYKVVFFKIEEIFFYKMTEVVDILDGLITEVEIKNFYNEIQDTPDRHTICEIMFRDINRIINDITNVNLGDGLRKLISVLTVNSPLYIFLKNLFGGKKLSNSMYVMAMSVICAYLNWDVLRYETVKNIICHASASYHTGYMFALCLLTNVHGYFSIIISDKLETRMVYKLHPCRTEKVGENLLTSSIFGEELGIVDDLFRMTVVTIDRHLLEPSDPYLFMSLMGFGYGPLPLLLDEIEAGRIMKFTESNEEVNAFICHVGRLLTSTNNKKLALTITFKSFITFLDVESRMYYIIKIFFRAIDFPVVEYDLMLAFMLNTFKWNGIPYTYICSVLAVAHKLLLENDVICLVQFHSKRTCLGYVIMDQEKHFAMFDISLLTSNNGKTDSFIRSIELTSKQVKTLKEPKKINVLFLPEFNLRFK